jgi:NitT/TauT family transport system substrate-binding protein
MPVITNLASPLLDFASRKGDGIRFAAVKFASFAEMAEALRHDRIQAAFMIAPLSIVLHQQGEDVRIVYIGNRHESTLVVRKDRDIDGIADLAGKTIAVPMRYSGHCLSMLQIMETPALAGRINLVEMNPPDMAAALAEGSLDGYFVGEPFAALSLRNGNGKVLRYVEEIWNGFICNLVLVKKSFIESNPGAVQALVEGAARSGLWAEANLGEAARIASRYWNQPVELVTYALSTPAGRIRFDRFVPKPAEIQHIADLMARHRMIATSDIGRLVEDRFARRANLEDITDLQSILYGRTAMLSDSRPSR